MSTFIKRYLFLFTLLLLSTISFSQNIGDSTANDNFKNYVKMSETNENHKLLASLVGTWTFTGKHIFPDASMKPITFGGTIIKKAIWGSRFFITETTGGEKPMPWSKGKLVIYKEMMIEGYDNVKKKFVSSTINNESDTGILTAEGTYDAATKTFTYIDESESHSHEDNAVGTKMAFRTLVKIQDSNHFSIEAYEIIDGKDVITTELKHTRIKSK